MAIFCVEERCESFTQKFLCAAFFSLTCKSKQTIFSWETLENDKKSIKKQFSGGATLLAQHDDDEAC